MVLQHIGGGGYAVVCIRLYRSVLAADLPPVGYFARKNTLQLLRREICYTVVFIHEYNERLARKRRPDGALDFGIVSAAAVVEVYHYVRPSLFEKQ